MKTKNYGIISSIALDPIEKKPLYHFYPGSKILSVGSLGCNMSCPFCQNHYISKPTENVETDYISPENLLELAKEYVPKGNIGVAFTYNEPLMTYDFVRDTSILLKNKGLKSVVVTNGCFGDKVINEIIPFVDAYNIDLKGFRAEIYESFGGKLNQVLHFIERTSENAHIEVTSLIVPGFNDRVEDMENQAKWIASLNKDIVLHITRFFPRYKMLNEKPTNIKLLNILANTAKKYLNNVYIGNV